ncbi:MAG: hypothetical protein SGBAC_011135 [Bacillariaceae sp.]
MTTSHQEVPAMVDEGKQEDGSQGCVVKSGCKSVGVRDLILLAVYTIAIAACSLSYGYFTGARSAEKWCLSGAVPASLDGGLVVSSSTDAHVSNEGPNGLPRGLANRRMRVHSHVKFSSNKPRKEYGYIMDPADGENPVRLYVAESGEAKMVPIESDAHKRKLLAFTIKLQLAVVVLSLLVGSAFAAGEFLDYIYVPSTSADQSLHIRTVPRLGEDEILCIEEYDVGDYDDAVIERPDIGNLIDGGTPPQIPDRGGDSITTCTDVSSYNSAELDDELEDANADIIDHVDEDGDGLGHRRLLSFESRGGLLD